ncbi:MAG: MFS transporter [Coriobacteriia bacterium]|nr:MFS transporter [Coriobacteriia bacterium]
MSISISKRIDALPLTPLVLRVLLITGIGWMFDAMDQGMVSGILAAIGEDPNWAIGLTEKTFLISSGVVGMIIGAALSGIAADRWGRRTVIVTTLLIFSLGSALCGMAPNYVSLLIFRFITGLGLGGELPVASTLVSEFSPVKSRGRNVVILESFWAWGWIVAALVAYLAIPVYGWRVAFFIGAVPALFAAVLRFAVPESPRYLEAQGRHTEANALVHQMEVQAGVATKETLAEGAAKNAASNKQSNELLSESIKQEREPFLASLKSLFSGEHLRSTLVLWVLWFGINLGYYGFVLWTPSLLLAQGFTLTKSLEFVLIMCFAQLPGYFLAAYLIEKLGRKPVLAGFFLGTAFAAWFFGQAGSDGQILAAGCLLYFFALGAWGCVYSYTPELYPTKIRGLGVGWAASFGRVGTLVAPFLLPALYAFFGSENGFSILFVLLTVVFAVVALVVVIFGRETMNVALDTSFASLKDKDGKQPSALATVWNNIKSSKLDLAQAVLSAVLLLLLLVFWFVLWAALELNMVVF